MSEEIIKVFDYIGEKLGIAIDYTQKNIQPYLEDLWHRYILYETVNHAIWLSIFLIGIIMCVYFILRYIKGKRKANEKGEIDFLFFHKKYYYSEERIEISDFGLFLLLISCFLLVLFTPFFIEQLSYVIELLIIPEKFMLELVKTI